MWSSGGFDWLSLKPPQLASIPDGNAPGGRPPLSDLDPIAAKHQGTRIADDRGGTRWACYVTPQIWCFRTVEAEKLVVT